MSVLYSPPDGRQRPAPARTGALRITIVSGPFLPMPPAPCGAVERVWHGLAEEFARRGHRVTVLCRAYPGQAADEPVGGVRYVRRLELRNTRRMAVNLVKDFLYGSRMLGLLPESDVLVTNTFWLPALAPLLRRRAGKVCVNVQRVPKGQLWLYGGAARLQAVSRAIRDEIVRQCPELASRVRVFPNPIRADVFTPPAAPRDANADPVLLYTGRVHPEKGLHVLIQAFAGMQRRGRLRLQIVGPWEVEQGGGGAEYLGRLRDMARGLPVEFRPAVYDRRELAKVYQAASYYCYPSLAEKGESFGVAPLEAMATGLVPVVSDLACFRDFIEDGRTGLYFDHRGADPAANLRGALERLMSEPRQVAAMSARAAARAQDFSYPKVAELYLADFRELAAGPAGEPPA